MVGKPQKIMSRRGGAKTRKLPLIVLLAVGGFAGWLYSNPKNQDKAMDFIGEVSADFPGTMAKLGNSLQHLPAPSEWGNSLGSVGTSLMRVYDRWVPVGFRDTLADGLPAVFAHPYLCKVSRVFQQGSAPGDHNSLLIAARIGGAETQLNSGALIRPGTELIGSARQTGVEIDCRKAKLVLSAGSDLRFARGEGSRKVLELTGGLTIQSEGPVQFGFAQSWGEVGLDFGDGVSSVQVTGRPDRASVRVFSGNADFIWNVSGVQNSPAEIFGIIGATGANVKIRRLEGSDRQIFPLGPRLQASFLANGKISGVAQGVRMDPAAPTSIAPNSSVAAQAPAAPSGPPGLQLVQPLIVKKTQWAGGVSQIDVLLEWRLNPTNRLVPCDIELAADATLKKVLARYQSGNMSLLLKGMRPGIYHWRANCQVDGSPQATPVGKIQVADGRASGAVPMLLTPQNGSRIKGPSVDFTWERVENSKFYVLQLSRDRQFGKFNEYLARQGTGLRMNLKVKGNYFWRVYGVGESKDKRTGFSPVWQFSH